MSEEDIEGAEGLEGMEGVEGSESTSGTEQNPVPPEMPPPEPPPKFDEGNTGNFIYKKNANELVRWDKDQNAAGTIYRKEAGSNEYANTKEEIAIQSSWVSKFVPLSGGTLYMTMPDGAIVDMPQKVQQYSKLLINKWLGIHMKWAQFKVFLQNTIPGSDMTYEDLWNSAVIMEGGESDFEGVISALTSNNILTDDQVLMLKEFSRVT